MNVLSILEHTKTLDGTALKAIRKVVKKSPQDLYVQLEEQGITIEMLREIVSKFYRLPIKGFEVDDTISKEVLELVSEESARHYRMVPLSIADGILEVAVADPDNYAVKDALNFIAGQHGITYKIVLMLDVDLDRALKLYTSLSGEVDRALTTLERELDAEVHKAEESGKEGAINTVEHFKEDAPVTKIVATILRYAVDGGASDIHIEPTPEHVQVRFRVDGLLATSLQLPKDVSSAVVARVKILSSMRLDEKRKPQDGRFSATFDGRKIDFRVSLLPTNHGEKVVMRILDTVSGVRSLEDAGISPHNLESIRRALQQPFGIILISGPTGSGKSTTLYSMLGEVDRVGKNVMSLEDPVEYNIGGVSQSQVRPEIGYTFAAGLRSALRQDPDIIMVGEIRDKETAQLAIQAALTGHLVFSTIHTNNSIGVIPRLIDMGVDPYLIAPTLRLAIAQRLVRRICPDTGKEESIEGSIQSMMDEQFSTLPEQYRHVIPDSKTILHPEPSPECANGTRGRAAVMETLEVTPEIERLILVGNSEKEIFEEARSNGFVTMREDAMIKALEHVIPYEEVSRFGIHGAGAEEDLQETTTAESVTEADEGVEEEVANVVGGAGEVFDVNAAERGELE